MTDAFRIARAADPAARLCYNDRGIEMPGPQAAAVLRLVKQLRMLRLIDCVGVETHVSVPGPPERALQTMLDRFVRAGVYVTISELDAQLRGDATLRQQAGTYRAVATACRSVRRCVRITTWGFTDESSWLGSSSRALPFDTRCRPKPAWSALERALAKSHG